MTDDGEDPSGGPQGETFELAPPTADRVARRALTLAAVACRSAIEDDADNPEAEAFRERVVVWAREIGIDSEIEQVEMTLLRTPLGKLSNRQRIDGTWRGEGLVVLAWALGRCELPAYDVLAAPYVVAEQIGFSEPAIDTVLVGARLRPPAEVSSLADDLLALHWRLRQFSLVGRAMDFASVAKTAWFGPLPVTHLRLAEGDLEIRGAPISQAPESVWREVMSIARERQQAANWLIGEEEIYSKVTCDT